MGIGDISLTSAMRNNLSYLQTVATLQGRTQERLSSGKKVNSALDNPTSYFTAQGLTNRANDIAGKKDGMSEAIQTVKAADTGIKQIQALIATARGIANQAKSAATGSGSTSYSLSLSGVTAGTAVTVGGSVFTAVAGAASATQFSIGATDSITASNLAYAINAGTEGTPITATAVTANKINLAHTDGTTMASGDLVIGGTVTSMTKTAVAGSTDRGNYASQFNTLMSEIQNLANVSGYKGVNLLTSNDLKVEFEKTNLTVSGFDGAAGIGNATATNTWASDTDVDADIAKLDTATTTLRQKSSALASNLSIITVNSDFSSEMITVLSNGADNLTNADMNEEGANMLTLQTRQSLGTSALSLSAQASQSITRLF